MDATTDDVHDGEVLPGLIANASGRRLIYEAYMDGSYAPSRNYALLRRMDVKPIIKPRRNAKGG